MDGNYLERVRARWRLWAGGSVDRRLFGAAALVAISSSGAKLVSIAKDLVVAAAFGTGDALDAFFLALAVVSFAVAVLAGSLESALLPPYVRSMVSEGPASAQEILSRTTALALVFLAATSVVLAVGAPVGMPVLGAGFGPEKSALSERLLFVLLPMLLLSGLSCIASAVLNSRERFTLEAAAPGAIPLVSVVAVLLWGRTAGIQALAVGTTAGAALELFVLLWALRRQGVTLAPRWEGMHPGVREVLGQYFPMVGGALLMGNAPLVDQAMASWLGPGMVAALNYGNKVVVTLLSIAAGALGTAALPYYSRMVATRDWADLQRTHGVYRRWIFLLGLPLTLLVFFSSNFLVRLLFQRGAFTEADTQLVGQIQAMYALQIPFYLGGIMNARLVTSLGRGQVLLHISAINLLLNITGNVVFSRLFGIAGIALSTSAVYLLSDRMLLFYIRRQMLRLEAGPGQVERELDSRSGACGAARDTGPGTHRHHDR